MLPVVVYLDNCSSVVSATTRVMLNGVTSGKIFFLILANFIRSEALEFNQLKSLDLAFYCYGKKKWARMLTGISEIKPTQYMCCKAQRIFTKDNQLVSSWCFIYVYLLC